jgi:hypothetical protein
MIPVIKMGNHRRDAECRSEPSSHKTFLGPVLVKGVAELRALIDPAALLGKIISWRGIHGGINSTLNQGNLQASGMHVIALGPKFSIFMFTGWL